MKFSSILLILCVLLWGCKQKNTTLFEELSSEKTGVTFNNTISDNDSFNILTYEYIYNGGGVAIADFNQDGLQDLFFSGNQVENKLYLNKGDWKFEDITAQAGVGGKERWKSGVAITDLNYDGRMDIYVACMTYSPGPRRANLFYVNQGNDKNGRPTFKEMAAEYGIADTAYTTACAFLDYDNDGDQDLYLAVNHQRKKGSNNLSANSFHSRNPDSISFNHDKLYRNDWDARRKHAVFTDVSLAAGIKGEGYGLAINITDLNRDGWKDIYVSNDYLTNDHLYINNQDGTFTDRLGEYLKHTSYSAMGNEVVDLNNDGLVDILAVDMMPEDNYRRKTMLPANNYNTFQNFEEFKYVHQYVRNTLQLNRGNAPGTNTPVFSEISMFAGISSTDWSWTPLSADFDQDGYRDLIVTNGFPKDVTDLDFGDYNSNANTYASPGFLNDNIPSVKLKNYAFRNRGDLTFENMGEKWGITETSFSNGAAYGDLDNDGDLDYVVNNINDPASIFRNNAIVGASLSGAPGGGKGDREGRPYGWLGVRLHGDSLNPMGLGTWIEIQYGDDQKQVWEHSIYRGYLSSMQALAHFGLGKNEVVDKVIITWPNQKGQVLTQVKANQVLDINYQDAKLSQAPPPPPPIQPWFNNVTAATGVNYMHTETDFIDFNLQPLLPHKLSQYGPGLAVADVNGDQLDDFFVSAGHFRKGRFFIQKTDGTFQERDLLEGPDGRDKRGEDLGVLFFDADGDGDEDLYSVRGGVEYPADEPSYQDILYLNNGGQFSPAKDALPAFLKSGSCVRAADYDRDGDLDLFIGGRTRHKEYPKPVSSYLLRNESKAGKPKFVLANDQVAPQLNDLGLVCDALWTDYDQDGWVDLMLAGEWMPLTLFKNNQGKLSNATKGSGLENFPGWWNSLVGADFDADGDIDYLAGNLGLNTLFKASPKQPLGVYAADFDGNQGYDVIPSVFFPNQKGALEEFPYHNRLDMDKQLILSKRSYLMHAEFAQINMTQYLSNFPTIKPLHLTATHLQSSFIRNLGKGKFVVEALPDAAQLAPIYGMMTGDWNADGHLDALCVGNDYGMEVTTGHCDALSGLLLLGNSKGGFTNCSLQQSGFYVPGDAKSLVQLGNAKGELYLVAGQNRGSLQVFTSFASGTKLSNYTQNDAQAEVKLKDGKVLFYELYHGAGFLSQSARKIAIPKIAKEITYTDFRGKKRVVKF